MTENPKLENTDGSDDIRSNLEGRRKLRENGGQKICVSDNVKGRGEPDSFVVDMEGLSHLIEKDINSNSRITLQRSVTRKASVKSVEKKITGNERDDSTLISSQRGTVQGSSGVPEKPAAGVVAMGPTDHHLVAVPQVHHQITITNGCVSSAGPGAAGKRLGFRRSTRAWILDSRKIFFFFATLSCMGTMLLIYFTLSMSKVDGGDSSLN